MTLSEKHSQELAKVAERIALEDFNQVEDKHSFSEEYQQKKQTFLDSVDKLEQKAPRKRYKKRLIAIAAGVLIGLPTTAFAAKKLYEVVVQKDNYELKMSVKGNGEAAKKNHSYKLKLAYLPENMLKDGESDKYSYTDNASKGGFSFILWKIDKKADFSSLGVKDYQEKTYGSNKIIMATGVDTGRKEMFNRHAFLMFEEEGYMLETFIGDDVPEADMEKVFANISLEETTKDQATHYMDYDEYLDNAKQVEIKEVGLSEDSSQLYQIGDTLKPGGMAELSPGDINYTVNKVEIKDTFTDLASSNTNSMTRDILTEGQMIDKDGKLLPYERIRYAAGDGKTTLDEVIEKKIVQPKLVYLTVTVENLTDQTIEEYYFQDRLTILEKEQGQWRLNSANFTEPGVYTGEVDYLDSHGEDKSFYRMPAIQSHEKRQVHVGYMVDEDKLDQMFIEVHGMGGMGEDLVDDLGASNRWWVDIRQ